MNEESGQVIIPYVTIERVVEVLNVIYKKGNKEITTEDLSSLLGTGQSSINNVTPTLGILGLITIEKRVITLTNDGMEFISAYNTDKLEIAKRIIRKSLEQSESLKFVKSLLDTRIQLTGEDIGKSLSDRFNKQWKHLGSIRTFGNSCASIISFAGYGYYNNGVLALKPITSKSDNGVYPPEVGYLPIVSLLNALNPFERAKVSDLATKLQSKDSTIGKELTVIVSLGLASKDVSGGFSITDKGRRLIDPRSSEAARSHQFLECLLQSPYQEVIDRLRTTAEELTHESIGEDLAYVLRRDWTDTSKELYGKKFATWLFGADLIEKIGPNKFKVKVKDIQQATITDKPKIDKSQLKELYEIARAIGGLEIITPIQDNKKEFEDRVSLLSSMLKVHGDLSLIFEMLKMNFEASVLANNPSIYKNNIDFVIEKIKEKLSFSE